MNYKTKRILDAYVSNVLWSLFKKTCNANSNYWQNCDGWKDEWRQDKFNNYIKRCLLKRIRDCQKDDIKSSQYRKKHKL